jgi:putative ABC transport system permease protein
MKAVWRVARAAVRRRRLQTIVIGVVVLVSTATIVLALGLLTTASAPFDRAHAQQSGPHLVTAFDRAAVSDAQVSGTADQPVVSAAAGPFAQATLDITGNGGQEMRPSLTTVGRAEPGGPVDRLNVWQGRWATAEGEIVLGYIPGRPGPMQVGDRISLPDGPTLTVVGFAYSVSRSAEAWVTPEQMADLAPTTTQMLYRFTNAATSADIAAGKAAVTEGLPGKALLGAESYLALKQDIASESAVYIPFLIVFGVLGVAVAVLIVGNVIGGAVVAGYRNIGMLKALGFTPNQVMTVYLVMVTVPSVIGCVLGTVLGNVVAQPLLTEAFESYGSSDVSVDLWVSVLALLGMPAVVALAALMSALRARGLSAAEAISAGSAPRTGRALRIQRWLGGVRLPRSVSLGLGVPFARPARSGLTLAAVVLGVMTVTLAIGVMLSVTAYRDAVDPDYTDRVELLAPMVGDGPRRAPVDPTEPAVAPTLTDEEDEALLRSTPGAARVAAIAEQPVHVVGSREVVALRAYRGDAQLGPRLDVGHWPTGPNEVAVPSRFLNGQGLAVGDSITIEHDGTRVRLEIVAVTVTNPAGELFADWSLIDRLAPDVRANSYLVQFEQGADQREYIDAVEAAEPGLEALPQAGGSSSQAVVLISSATILTIVLGAVAALGVFNTVVLNARERRRDLGMLKSIGMTPRQVTVMMVTSMGALGVVGGLLGVPLGVAAHQVIAPAMMRAAQSNVFGFVVDVYHVPLLVLLGLAGVVIAVLGAVIPARSAARVPIATVLHNE